MALVVTVIDERPEAFILGIYSSREEAKEDYYKLLKEQKGFPKLSDLFKEQFGFPLTDLDNSALNHLIDDLRYEDFFIHHLKVYFVDAQPGELFDFTDWDTWNVYNLFPALEMILQGRTGHPSEWRPKRRTCLFLRNLK